MGPRACLPADNDLLRRGNWFGGVFTGRSIQTTRDVRWAGDEVSARSARRSRDPPFSRNRNLSTSVDDAARWVYAASSAALWVCGMGLQCCVLGSSAFGCWVTGVGVNRSLRPLGRGGAGTAAGDRPPDSSTVRVPRKDGGPADRRWWLVRRICSWRAQRRNAFGADPCGGLLWRRSGLSGAEEARSSREDRNARFITVSPSHGEPSPLAGTPILKQDPTRPLRTDPL